MLDPRALAIKNPSMAYLSLVLVLLAATGAVRPCLRRHALQLAREKGLRHAPERISASRRKRLLFTRRSSWNVFDREIDRLQHGGADLGGQPAIEHERAVVVVTDADATVAMLLRLT